MTYKVSIELSKDLSLTHIIDDELEPMNHPYSLNVDKIDNHNPLLFLRVKSNTWAKEELAKHLNEAWINHLDNLQSLLKSGLEGEVLSFTLTPHMSIKYSPQC